MSYQPDAKRYENGMLYNRCGRSGLRLPAVSLGLWHNFGHAAAPETRRETVTTAFDLGITHFDLANNYGPPPGSAEESFGALLRETLAPWRDELVISTKAGPRLSAQSAEQVAATGRLFDAVRDHRVIEMSYFSVSARYSSYTLLPAVKKPVMSVSMAKRVREARAMRFITTTKAMMSLLLV